MPTVKQLVVSTGIALSSAVLFVGCGEKPETDPVVLSVGEREIRLSELQAQLDHWVASGSVLPTDRQAFIKRYTERVVALEKAYALGLDQDPELRSQWESLLLGRLRSVELENAMQEVQVSPDQVQEYYDAHIDDYTRHAQVRVALLYLPFEVKGSEAAHDTTLARLQEARELATDLPEETRGFGALAMKYSEEPSSRFKGGDTGWMQAGRENYRWPQSVVDAAFALKATGELSEIIETDKGAYLLMHLDGRPEQIQPLNERVSKSIYATLEREAREHAKLDLQKSWGEGLPVELNAAALEALNFQNTSNSDQASGKEFSRLP